MHPPPSLLPLFMLFTSLMMLCEISIFPPNCVSRLDRCEMERASVRMNRKKIAFARNWLRVMQLMDLPDASVRYAEVGFKAFIRGSIGIKALISFMDVSDEGPLFVRFMLEVACKSLRVVPYRKWKPSASAASSASAHPKRFCRTLASSTVSVCKQCLTFEAVPQRCDCGKVCVSSCEGCLALCRECE